ncbi:MAG: sigma-54 dependent transcriptional regulator [Deferribacteraceae bacterium]|jgi:two-component system response regulator HydG|nr:sigma-54 dependent transcriptional regulator [Deferribacteraceae bacterium]
MKNLLIIDDEKNHRHMLRLHLEDAGYICWEADNGAVAIAALNDLSYDLLLLDITMDIMDGLTFLSYIRSDGNNVPVVIITANADAKTAVSAMKLGATDYVTKPVDIDELLSTVENLIIGKNRDESEIGGFSHRDESYFFHGVYSKEGMGKVIDMLKMVAPTDATVLITGESGTGKELVAKSVHDNSSRAGKAFVAVNAAALNENLIESELFGHVKGAFTGAAGARSGRFTEANGGTLFLDEIGELPVSAQVKLLRFLQERVYEPVGSSKPLQADVRVIAATNRDLNSMVTEGGFRQDLFFRLSVFPIHIPPLRERASEIPMLVKYFTDKYSERFQKKISGASVSFIKTLQQYPFPGNVRELENLLERSIILARTDLLTEELLPKLTNEIRTPQLKESEKQIITETLRECENNRTKAAERLGISRRGLYNKLREYGLD